MCGIFGILYHNEQFVPNAELLNATVQNLQHRGPDSHNAYTDIGIGLVHTRLSLLDLNPRSDQPFWDNSGRYCLVYNGEIYNFIELRADLEKHGVKFRTTSDTEVLLQYLLNDGFEASLPKLEGMFAFALWDKIEQCLTLAIDRFGIKPLYVFEDDSKFVFSSEVKGMSPWINLRPDLLSISSFLQGGGGPTKGFTFFENVVRLSPGSIVKIRKSKKPEFSSFFCIPDLLDRDQMDRLNQYKPSQLVDEVEELLLESVRKHLLADAPVGAFCSGGIDSSIIMAMATKYHNNLAIFHANVKGPFSEYEAALLLAKYLKLDLKVVVVNDQDFIDQIPDVIQHYEYPFWYHPNSVPFLMVSRLVHENKVKAILSGEGADECFLGYQWIATWGIINACSRLSTRAGKWMRKIPLFGPALWPYDDTNTRFIENLHNRFEIALEDQINRARMNALVGKMAQDRNIHSLNLLNYHLRTLLHRNDCLGMAASIEARFPFLDNKLVKFAVNMPYNTKIRFSPTVFERAHPFFRDKWVIRKVADRYIPKQLSQRKKMGFHVTVYDRMRILPSYFDSSLVADILGLSREATKFFTENAPHSSMIQLMLLDVWAHVCLHGLPRESILNKLRQHIILN